MNEGTVTLMWLIILHYRQNSLPTLSIGIVLMSLFERRLKVGMSMLQIIKLHPPIISRHV